MWESPRRQAEGQIGFLQVDGHRVVNDRRDAVLLEILTQRVAPPMPDDIQVIDRLRGGQRRRNGEFGQSGEGRRVTGSGRAALTAENLRLPVK